MQLRFDFASAVPLYQQLRNQVVLGIAQGQLQPGDHLPAVRALADESGVNTMTISKGYQLLKQEGYLQTDRRRGAVICRRGEAPPSEETLSALRLHLAELHLAGLSREEILTLCEQLFQEGTT